MGNLFSLEGKTAVLAGASGFFGKYFLEALLASGARVILVDKSEKIAEVAEEYGKTYGSEKVAVHQIDLYDREATGKAYKSIVAEEEKIDILVNNAFDFSLNTGFNDDSGRIENATFEQLEKSFESGIYWAIHATQVIGAKMKEQENGGSIINICSMYGVVVPDFRLYVGTKKFNPPGYSMAKAGLMQFTKYAASFMGPKLRVNAISPGAFPNMESQTYNAVSPEEQEFLERLRNKTLLDRLGHPKELQGALIFLASEASSYITGQNIIIDGGWTVI